MSEYINTLYPGAHEAKTMLDKAIESRELFDQGKIEQAEVPFNHAIAIQRELHEEKPIRPLEE